MYRPEGVLVVVLFLCSGISILTLSISVYRNKRSPLSRIFFFLGISGAFWVFSHLFELVSPGSFGTLLWGKLKYMGIATLPVFWLVFALQYTGRGRYVTWRSIALLLVVPIIVLFSLWTNSYHHLFYRELVIKELGGVTYFYSVFGPFFWLSAVYDYILVFSGVVLILYSLADLHRTYWKQATVIAVGVLIPLLGSILYVSGPSPDLDITPVLFLPASISLTFGVRNFHFLDAFLIGRKTVFQKISNAIFVLDQDRNVIDLNRAGEELAEETERYGDIIGRDVGDVFSEKFDFSEVIDSEGEAVTEFKLAKNGEERHFQAQIGPLRESGENQVGWIIIVRDVTEHEKTRERKDFLNNLLRQDLGGKYRTIQGYLQLLEEVDLPDEHREYLRRAVKAGGEADEILELAKKLEEIEEVGWVAERDISKIVEHVVEQISVSAEREEVEIVEAYPEAVAGVRGDYSLDVLFSQILKTRIRNPECSKIVIEVEEREENVSVSVEDDGEKLVDAIKNLFSGEVYRGGTAGVGGARYYMLRQIAEHNNADIEVRDSELGGARFEVHLQKA